MKKGWVVPIDEIAGLKEVYNRLQAWAENERLWARRMPDGLEADANLNRAKNYEFMLPKIEAAITRLGRPSKTVSDTGTVSPMIMGAFWIVPAVWLLMHFAVLQVVASFGR